MNEELLHLTKYFETGVLELQPFSNLGSFRKYLDGQKWSGSSIDWEGVPHISIDFERTPFCDPNIIETHFMNKKMVFSFAAIQYEPVVVIANPEIGIEMLDEIYWNFPPFQYGFMADDKDVFAERNFRFYFETNISTFCKIRL